MIKIKALQKLIIQEKYELIEKWILQLLKSTDKTVNFNSFLEIDEHSIFSDEFKKNIYIYSIQYPQGQVIIIL